MPSPLDPIWIDAARRLGIPVERGGEAYVHFDGERLHLASDEHLDADDTIAQLVLHEICHALVEGPAARQVADWGLDNTSDRDEIRERAAVRLQAHLTGAHGLRAHLYPTTIVRAFFEALPSDAFAPVGGPGDDDSPSLARDAAERSARAPYGTVLKDALAKSAEQAGLPLHPKSGHPLRTVEPASTCGDCVWRSAGGLCRQAATRKLVRADERACVRWEGALDCLVCGACCRSAYDSVTVGARDPVVRRHPQLIVHREQYLELRRDGDRCAALGGPTGGPYACAIYDDRPRTCRDFTAGGRHCLSARRKVGLSA